MTDDVADLVLRNNYLQTLCLSLARGAGHRGERLCHAAHAAGSNRGVLDRKLKALPGDHRGHPNATQGRRADAARSSRCSWPMRRSSSKDDLVASDSPMIPICPVSLKRYFPGHAGAFRGRDRKPPPAPRDHFHRAGQQHDQSRRPKLIAGVTDETRRPGDIAVAFAVARDSFGFTDLNRPVDELEARIPGGCRTGFTSKSSAPFAATIWFLRHEKFGRRTGELIARYRDGIGNIGPRCQRRCRRRQRVRDGERKIELENQRVPQRLPGGLARLAS